MRKPIIQLILLSFLIAYSPSLYAGLFCAQVYSRIKPTSSTNIGFSQNFLGHVWAKMKVQALKEDYSKWSPDKGKKSKGRFVIEITKNSPFPVYRDIYGQLRLLDSHHKFFSISEFMGNKSFDVSYRVEKDYMEYNPKTGEKWTEKEMMLDLIENNYLFIKDNDTPQYSDLKAIPTKIKDIPDFPERTIISLVFAAFATPMKGSDFTPMIQLFFADFMIDTGHVVVYKKPYSDASIKKIIENIINSKELLEFLHNHINRSNKPERIEELEKFFDSHIETIKDQVFLFYFDTRIHA